MIALLAAPVSARAAEITADPSNYRARLLSLAPGDTLRLAPGTYTNGLPLVNVHGAPSAPITIAGATSGGVSTFLGRACCNTVSLTNVSYVIIRDLLLDGQNYPVNGVKAEATSISVHHVTIERLTIRNHGSDQQIVGISTKCPAWDWVIRRNRIERPGTGLYLGNSDGRWPFIRGVIEENVVIDPIGYAMQIKHQAPRPVLPGMPAGDSSTIIRDNVFIKASNASLGSNARPNLLVGHWPLSGVGQNDRYEIYGNLLFQNSSGTEPLFQGEGHLTFHDNLLVSSYGPGIAIRPHNDVPRAISVYRNTVYSAYGTGISVTGASAAYPQHVVANSVFSPSPIVATTGVVRDNLVSSYGSASAFLRAPSTALATADFYPLAGRLTGTAVDLSPFERDLHRWRDFNGSSRGTTYRGAYEGGRELNPGGSLMLRVNAAGVRAR